MVQKLVHDEQLYQVLADKDFKGVSVLDDELIFFLDTYTTNPFDYGTQK